MIERQEIPNKSGVYSLIIYLSKETTLRVGALGIQTIPLGYYVYTGSAFGPGGLKSRVEYHRKKNESRSGSVWHVDILLAHENATLIEVITLRTMRKLECEINQLINKRAGAKIPIPGFGASDCKKQCISHLLFFSSLKKEASVIQKVQDSYAQYVEDSKI